MANDIKATGYLAKVLTADERVLLITRRHWLVEVFKTVWWALAFMLLAGGAVFLYATRASPDDWRWAGLALTSLVPLAGWVWEHLVWRNQMHVMTDRRVLQMHGVLSKTVSDSLLEKLNDVKTEQSLLGRILGYGDILILTASEQGANTLKTIADPLGFKRAMLEAKEALEEPPASNPEPDRV